MRFSHLLAIASSVILAAAAPTTAPVHITEDDVILYSKDGRYQVMKKDDFAELQAARLNGTKPPMPGYLDPTLYHGPGNETHHPHHHNATSRSLDKRVENTVFIKNPHQRFLGWDVQMSAVVKGAEKSGTTITVSSGYSIANSITVGVSSTYTIVEKVLEASVKIDYGITWTSSQTQGFTATVQPGKYGCYVSNAYTNRESGNVFQGRIGSAGSLSYYQGDSFESKSYGNLAWVDGVISLCTGTEFPLKRCLGSGTL